MYYKACMTFEDEVRRTAEAIWALQPGACLPKHYANEPGIRELDGIARLRDVTHLIMITTSQRLSKCKEDVSKLEHAAKIEMRRGAPAVAKWYITKETLNAEHLTHCKKNGVTASTLHDFRRRFFDGDKYLIRREEAPFGSARNPLDYSINIDRHAYVELPMRMIEKVTVGGSRHAAHQEMKESSVTIADLESYIGESEVLILTAPFGAGKSLTTREVYYRLAARYRRGDEGRVPVVLNLREHWAEPFCDEILERHARSIGYAPKEDLVIAWRAGLVDLLIDGFDEVAAQSVVRRDDVNFMRDARHSALTGVRDFMTKLPAGTGVMICGRDHYFDSDRELEHALGLHGRQYKRIQLDEFTEDGVITFLRNNGISQALPDWLPRKPLILAYLAQKDMFDDIVEIDSSLGFGHAWNTFLDRIAAREAQLEKAVMEPGTLRGVMERLAMLVRSRASGVGPISGADLSEAYAAETSQAASEGVLAQLQRLPGLTQRGQDPGLRSFVDEDMMFALQGSALARLIVSQFESNIAEPLDALSEKAISMAAFQLSKQNTSFEAVISAAARLKNLRLGRHGDQLVADCCAVAMHLAIEQGEERIDFRKLEVLEAAFSSLDLEALSIDAMRLRNCIVHNVLVGPIGLKGSLRLESCLIGRMAGVAGMQGVPRPMFGEDCTIDHFDSVATSNAVQQLPIAPQLRALLMIFRKLYKQAGGGRKLAAFHRGIVSGDVAPYVDGVIHLLEREGFLGVFNKVVHPVRKQAARVERILGAPTLSNDPIIAQVLSL